MHQAFTTLPKPKRPLHWLAFGLGLGLAPKAPGTFGTLLGLPFFLLLGNQPVAVYVAMLALLAAAGIWICGKTAQDLGVHDHPGIVWDEVVGYLVTMTAMPMTPWSMLAGFITFRVFDIWKPWPIGALDRQVSGGLGIMLDDIAAGLFAALVLQLGQIVFV